MHMDSCTFTSVLHELLAPDSCVKCPIVVPRRIKPIINLSFTLCHVFYRRKLVVAIEDDINDRCARLNVRETTVRTGVGNGSFWLTVLRCILAAPLCIRPAKQSLLLICRIEVLSLVTVLLFAYPTDLLYPLQDASDVTYLETYAFLHFRK